MTPTRAATLWREHRLPLAISALLLIVVSGFSWVAFLQVRSVTRAAAEQHVMRVTGQLEAALRAGSPQRLSEARRAAAQPAFRTYLLRKEAAARAPALDALKALTASDSLNGAADLWDRAGQRTLSAGFELPPVKLGAAHALVERASDSGAALGPLRVVGSWLWFPVIAAVSANGSVAGHVVIWRRILNTPEATRRIVELIGQDASLLVGNVRGDVWTDLIGPVDGPPLDMTQVRTVVEYERLGRARYLAGALAIAGTPWILVVELPLDRALAPARSFLRRIGAVALLFLGIGAAGAWLVNRQIAVPQRQQAEEQLQATSERHHHTLENMMEGCQIVDPEGRYLFVNAAAARQGRRSPTELIGRRMQDVYPGVETTEMFAALRRCALEHVPVQMENEFQYPDGSTGWFDVRMQPVPEGVFVLSIDITERNRYAIERQQAEDALRQSETHYRTILENIADGVFITDHEGRFLDVNPRACELTGYTREELLNRKSADTYPPNDRADAATRLAEIAAGRPAFFERPLLRRDGSIGVVEINARALADGRFLATMRDVTERRQLETQLRQAQKMEAVGRLAGGVAHDFNNILTAIFGYADLLAEEFPDASPARQAIEEIRKAAQRASGLTRQLLAFSRQQVLEPVVLNINELVQDFDKMLRRVVGEDIELRLALSPAIGNVRADTGQLQQVIMNLAVNARDAMPTGGKLLIETVNTDLTEAYAAKHQPVVPGPYVMLAVSDTGTGMDPETKAKVFEPFFTTKEKGKGTGLGLSTVYGIVKQSGGYVWVYSEIGRGSTFKIYLPRVDAPADQVVAPPKSKTLAGTETILLAEDDAMLRPLTKGLLQKLGYRVFDAESAEQALAIAGATTDRIHLLIADVVMPGASGRELARRLAKSRPDAKVLYVSGYTDDAIVHHGMLEPGLNFLQKPFTPAELSRKVRDVLDGR
ncbi:MAG TPA: PAS domain S-box protein [Gemmatimonadales bacterium]